LLPYAAFCALRDRFGTPDPTMWKEYAVFSQAVLNRALDEFKDEVDLNCYIQFNLDRQMRAVHEYANANGVALKGDIPIGISRTSVDAWVNPQLFYMDCQAGAPPDDFSVLGENWGFPTYNW
ncbi:MAG: 4-alpha-glucanotransferase, partial [Muribaculaceae bacterium]|nr:4-alpha-glucanotransferase [Muribaculaceae bacterium]